MSTTIIAIYDDPRQAQQAIEQITTDGVSRDAINVLDRAGNGKAVESLTELGLEEQEATVYAEVIGKGAAMVVVEAPDDAAERTCEIMNRFGAQDLDKLLQEARGKPAVGEQHERVPVVEEQVAIGKRKVVRGGVRVTSKVVERPVEQTLRLREEKVDVDRHRTDRKLSPEEAEKAFTEQTLEVKETAEEAVISKEARVVEEISLRKTAEEYEETVRATARRTEVAVEDIEPREAQLEKQLS